MRELPFKVTKDEYLEFVGNTNFIDSDLQKQLDNAVTFVLLYTQYVSSRNWMKRFEHKIVSDYQLEAFKRAVIYQVAYIEANGGDVMWTNGYNSTSNTFISNATLFEKYIAPMSKIELSTSGILYSGVRVC